MVRSVEDVLAEYAEASIPFVEQVGHGREDLQLFRHPMLGVRIDREVAKETLDEGEKCDSANVLSRSLPE